MKKELFNLTNPQKSILLTEEFYKGCNINNICGTAIIEDKVDFELLKKAMHIFVKNHDSFNMKLVLDNNEIKQYLDDIADIDVEIVELNSKDDIATLEKTMLNHVFDIYNGDLFEMKIFKLKDASGGFIVNVHHLFGDSWSLGIVANDIVRIYSCLLNGEEVINNNFSYIDYIYSEKEYLESAKYVKDKEYWNSIFSTIPEQATIPSHIQDTSNDFDCAACRSMFNIDNKLMAKINDFCKLNHVSVFNFFMAVYSIYIGRVSNLDDFVIGTPILNRTNFKEKNTTGMFINTAPLRVNIDGNLSFKSFVENIAKDSLGMLRHQKYYYQNILEDLRKNNPNLPNLYNVLISYQITNANTQRDVNYSTRWSFNGNIGDDIDIHLFDLNGTGSINVAYDYKVSKYEDSDISDMHNRILHIIWQILEKDNIYLKDIEIVTTKEKYDILYKFNGTDADYPKDKTIVDLFEEQVEKTPDNIAIVFEEQKLTYKELNEKANRLARYLETINVKEHDIVSILLTRSPELIISVLAVLKIGACYVPIDTNYPKNRIEYILNSSNSIILITNSNLMYNSNISVFIDKIDALSQFEAENLNHSIDTSNLAYIIYTSGSTGNPKGVTISHKSLVNYIYWANRFYGNGKPLNYPFYSSFGFDLTVTSIYTPLICGGSIIIYEDNDILLTLKKIFNDKLSDIIKLTPAHLSLVQELDFSSTNISKMIVGGDILTEEICKKITDKFNHISIYNEYGPTEATVGCMIYEYCLSSTQYNSVPIGRPINNVGIYILDKYLNLLPNYCEGEIYIGGDCLSLGYQNSDLNKDKFIRSPFDNTKLLYKTGDIAVLHKENILEYIGRNDFQVKLNGFRIEIGEITKNTLKFDSIKDCFIDVYDLSGRKMLCGFYVSNNIIDTNDLNSFLSNFMPDYMIPKIWTKIDYIPLTINGKVNKSLLPLPAIKVDNDIVSPRNNNDTTILKYVNQLLSSTINNLNCNLFEIGFDSLLAIKLAMRLSQEYNINISVKDIFEHSMIRELSDYISTLSKAQINCIQPAMKMDFYPTSSAQKRIYYASSLDNNSTLYNIAGGIIVNDLLDVDKLQNCLNTLVNRHDALRTHFAIHDNDIVQIIDDKIDFNLEIETASTDDLNDIYSNFVKPFDVSKAPLFRAKLVTLKDNKTLFLIDMHHIVSDGTSLSILLQELCDLYNGNTLPEKQLDYKDFTLWEKEQFNNDEFNNSKDFWVNQFIDEIPLLNMPTSYPRPSVQSFEGCNYHTSLSKDVFEKINTVSKNLGITPYMLMLSCYYILLSKYSSNDDIVVGTPIVGRELHDVSNMLGMFVNTLALRNKVDSSIGFNDFANSIKDYCLDCFGHQSYPFDELVKALNIKRDTSRNPLFDVMFIYQNNGYPKINFKDADVEYFIPDNNISKFDLSLEVIPMDNEFLLRFEYCTKLYSEDFIKRLSSHYINILNVILENYEVKIADIDMMSKEEKNQILYDFNNTTIDYPRDKTIVDLFEEQVEKTPDNIAVVFEDKQLTYRELNEKANQLARYLTSNNVLPGDVVCLLLDKSLESIISIIASLKIGAAYLPIDVNYPIDRIDYIIRDSNSRILLTTKNNIHKSNGAIQSLCIDMDSSIYSQNSFENINCRDISFDSVAYIMYTSGSTGNPKGVMVKHRNIVRLVKNNKFIKFDNMERILQTGSIVFDACTFEIFGALLNGFELYIIKKEVLLDALLLQDYLIKNNITILWLTAPLFNQLCEENPHMFRGVKALLTGGDVLSPKHINMVRVANPNLTVINGYGPTENTTFSCCFTIDTEYSDSIPIGKPISNSTAYIVSSSGFLNPIGVPGELWVGGDGVSKGYLNNYKLTNEKFIKNPFGDGILYKTGDLVKWLPDGNIEFMGRIDNQVKIRGFRVELGEINSKISTFPSMKECVTVVNNINGEKSICSYIVANKEINIQELKQYLKRHLPVYMIPTYFMQLEKLPINTNGKVDRKLLPTNFTSNHIKHTIQPPTNNTEKILLDIFKKLLSFDDIGIDDDFFELGGNSLLAIKLQVEAISNNLQINYADIFDHHSVRELSKCINHAKDALVENVSDYEKYNVVLENNKITDNMKISNTPVGNVLLTGFTGFLGAHVLDSFIKKENGTIYCLIRGKNNMSPEDRLKNVLHFYFDNKYDKYIGNRIKLIEGDITLQNFGLNTIDYNILGTNINTVIHCAALVKHYGSYNDFEKINIIGTKRVVDFCKAYNLQLLHVSTISVSGNNLAEGANIDNNFDKDMIFDETNFYIGQNLNNFYVRSKFEAEKLVLDAILDGLSGCILRMGNLTSRFSEGKFQQNHFENAFVNRLKSFLQIGIFPKSLLNLYCEFTPIDFCGDAIIDIANHMSKDYTVFHLLNEKHVNLDRLFDMLHEIGIDINLVSDENFSKTIQTILHDPNKKQELEGIINDLNSDKKLVYKSQVNIQSDFTKEFLQKVGFEWPYIDIKYIRNYFQYLIDIGYFNTKIN